MIKKFNNEDDLQDEHFEAYIESKRAKVANFNVLKSKVITVKNWYKACLEQGLPTDGEDVRRDRQDIGDVTRRRHSLAMSQLIKWVGTEDVTREDLDAYLEAHEEGWGKLCHRS